MSSAFISPLTALLVFFQVLESANMGTGPGLMYYGAAYGAHLLKNLEIPRGVEYRKLRGISGLAWAARRSFLNQIGTERDPLCVMMHFHL